MTKHTIQRDGRPPLTFTGEEIAKANNRTNDSTRWTEITIYVTKGGKFIGQIERVTKWQGESGSDDAESFTEFPALIKWLKGDDDRLGRVSQEAIEDAIKTRPELAVFWVEEVE